MFRLGAIYVIVISAALLIVAGLTLQYARNMAAIQRDHQMLSASKSLQNHFRIGVSSRVAFGQDLTSALVSEAANSLSYLPMLPGEAVSVRLQNVSLPLSTSGPDSSSAEASISRLVGISVKGWLTVHSERGEPIRVLRVPVQAPDGSDRGTMTIAMSQSDLDSSNIDIGLFKNICLAGGIVLPFALLVGLVWTRRVVAPIQGVPPQVEPIQLELDPTASHDHDLAPIPHHDLPPMLAEKLILLCTPRSQAQPLIGDLREEFSRFVLPQYGGSFARLWYWKQALSSMPPLLQWRLARFLYLGWLLDNVGRWLKGG
jgi:hypothetical protein